MCPGGVGKSDEGGRRYGIGCAAGGGWRRDGNDRCFARGTQERVFVVVCDDVSGFGEDGLLDWSGGGSGPGQITNSDLVRLLLKQIVVQFPSPLL